MRSPPFAGIIYGCLFGSVLWLIIIWAVWLLTK